MQQLLVFSVGLVVSDLGFWARCGAGSVLSLVCSSFLFQVIASVVFSRILNSAELMRHRILQFFGFLLSI
jgi:hypothetical protein